MTRTYMPQFDQLAPGLVTGYREQPFIGNDLHRRARELGWSVRLSGDGSELFVLTEIRHGYETLPLPLDRVTEILDAIEARLAGAMR